MQYLADETISIVRHTDVKPDVKTIVPATNAPKVVHEESNTTEVIAPVSTALITVEVEVHGRRHAHQEANTELSHTGNVMNDDKIDEVHALPKEVEGHHIHRRRVNEGERRVRKTVKRRARKAVKDTNHASTSAEGADASQTSNIADEDASGASVTRDPLRKPDSTTNRDDDKIDEVHDLPEEVEDHHIHLRRGNEKKVVKDTNHATTSAEEADASQTSNVIDNDASGVSMPRDPLRKPGSTTTRSDGAIENMNHGNEFGILVIAILSPFSTCERGF